MAWLRVSDSAGNNPVVLSPLIDSTPPPAMDAYLWANTLFGVVTRCATNAACYGRSYYVEDATIASYVGAQWRTVAEAAARAGYWTATPQGWQLVDDPQHLYHIRTGEEIDWEKARKADAANDALVVPVRMRDGDECRYCARIVSWRDNRSRRGGTYDHRIPGRQAESPDDLRVACRGCNSQRGDDPNADERMPPRPVPATPFYGHKTVAFLLERGFTVPESAPQRPGSLPDTATRDPATHAASDLEAAGGTPRPSDPAPGGTTLHSDRAAGATPLANAQLTVDAALAGTANRRATETQSPGRVGPDRVGSGRSGSGSRRARRGRRRRS